MTVRTLSGSRFSAKSKFGRVESAQTFWRGRYPNLTSQFVSSLLFFGGRQGYMLDPSDLSTLFQDSAGTIPVTAVEQFAGKILDVSGNGNHFVQATSAKRPVFSRRYNLLGGTNNFGGSYWIADDGTVAGGYADSSGGLTAYKYTPGVNNVGTHRLRQSCLGAAATRVLTFRFKPINYSYIKLRSNSTWANFNLSNKTVGYSSGILNATVADVGSGWFDVSIVSNGALANVYIYPMIDNVNSIDPPAFSGDGVSGVIVERAALVEEADAHLPYQWVNTATDYDADPAKFPAYLRFDGVDDAMESAAVVPMSGSDKVMVGAGVTKFNDAIGSYLLQAGLPAALENGSFVIMPSSFGASPAVRFEARGTISKSASGAHSAPVTMATLGIADIAAGLSLYSDGVQDIAITGSMGTGNFSNYTNYLFSTNGVIEYLSGRMYGILTRGGASTPDERAIVTAWLASKQKRTL